MFTDELAPSRAADSVCCPDCGRTLQIGDYPFGCNGSGDHKPHGGTLNSAIHTSERATIYRHPRTGAVRYPPRNDMPMPAKFAAQGFVREQIVTHQDRNALEKQTGRIQERAYFDSTTSAEHSLSTGISQPLPTKGLDSPD